MSSIQATRLTHKKLKEPLEKDSISFSFPNNTDNYLESSFDTSILDKSINEISQDKTSDFSNLTIELKKKSNQPINLKLIKENVSLKRKINSLIQFPDIQTLNKSSSENISTQTIQDGVEKALSLDMCTQTENIRIDSVTQTDKKEDLDQMIKVIQQFKSEKEKFKELFQEEQENNTELVRLLDEFKDKTENLRQDYSDLNVKLDQSINSEEVYMKQAKDLSEKCVLYSNQLFYSSQKVNELNQELQDIKQKLVDYEGAKELFSEKTGKLTSMILQEKRIHQEEVDLLKERINSILDTSQLDVPPLMGSEDQLILRKLQEKIVYLKQDADKEKRGGKELAEKCEKLFDQLEKTKKKSIDDKKELKRLQDRLEVNKEEISSFHKTISDYQNSIIKNEQEQALMDQKIKNLNGQMHAKDLIIKEQCKKYESICNEIENYKLKYDSLSQRQTITNNLKRDLLRKDELLKTYKSKIESLSKEFNETKMISDEPRKVKFKKISSMEGSIIKESERKYTQIVNVLTSLLVKAQISPIEWKNNVNLRNRMSSISFKFLGKQLDSFMQYPDYPSQLLEILSQDQFEPDLHAFLRDILCYQGN